MWDWIDIRTGIKGLIDAKFKGYRLPKETNIFHTLGIVIIMAYLGLAVTGYFLLIYYIPHPEHAFKGIQYIMTEVPYGWLVRMIHIVTSSLIVIVIFIHLISVFIMGGYKKPREVTWLTGGLLLLITLTFCLSGYLLPWSQKGYWATTIMTSMPTAIPVIGDFITRLIRGGEHVTGITLSRFLSIHVAFLPPLFLTLLGVHIFLIWRTGISVPGFSKSAMDEKEWRVYERRDYPDGYPLYPDFILKSVTSVMLFFAVTFFFIAFMPTSFFSETSNIPADPLMTPLRIKPEWYFIAPYQFFRIMPNKFLAISIEIILFLIFLFLPFIDRAREKNILKRPVLLLIFIAMVIIWFIFTLWGRY